MINPSEYDYRKEKEIIRNGLLKSGAAAAGKAKGDFILII